MLKMMEEKNIAFKFYIRADGLWAIKDEIRRVLVRKRRTVNAKEYQLKQQKGNHFFSNFLLIDL